MRKSAQHMPHPPQHLTEEGKRRRTRRHNDSAQGKGHTDRRNTSPNRRKSGSCGRNKSARQGKSCTTRRKTDQMKVMFAQDKVKASNKQV